jgi:hypothetical protein
VIRHHAAGGDFSRWIAEVIQDPVLAQNLRVLEERARRADLEELRREILRAIEERYLD